MKRNKPLFAYKEKTSSLVNGFSTMSTQQDSSKNRPLGTWPLASMDFHPVQGEFPEALNPPSSAFMSSAAKRIVTCFCSLLVLNRAKAEVGFCVG